MQFQSAIFVAPDRLLSWGFDFLSFVAVCEHKLNTQTDSLGILSGFLYDTILLFVLQSEEGLKEMQD